MTPDFVASLAASLRAEYQANLTKIASLPTVSVSDQGRSLSVEAARQSLTDRNKAILQELQTLSPVDFVVAAVPGY